MKRRIGECIVATNISPLKRCDGSHTIRIRVQYHGTSRYYSTNYSLTDRQYKSFLLDKTGKEPLDEYSDIHSVFERFCKTVHKLEDSGEFSFSRVLSLTKHKSKTSVQGLIEDKINELATNGQNKTAVIYKCVLSAMEKFTKGKAMEVTRFTQQDAQDFLRFLEKKGASNTTINIYFRSLSCVLEKAVKDYIIIRNPMKGIKKPSATRRYMNISEHTLRTLLSIKEDELEPFSYRQLCLFRAIYYGNGMNVTDILHLKKENIRNSEIVFQRHKTQRKTGITVYVPLTPELNEALDFLIRSSDGRRGAYLIPDLNGYVKGSAREESRIVQIVKNANNHLKKICNAYGIEKVTTYTARHQFATQMLRNGVPIEYISSAMGHSSILTTQHYLEGYTMETRARYSQLLSLKK